MKRLILLSILAVALAFLYCSRELAGPKALASMEQERETSIAGPHTPQARAAATLVATASGVRAASSSPLTDDRRRIFDSPDVMGTINQVRANGTSDEKEWALYLLVACVHANARFSALQADAADREQDQSASTPSRIALAALKRQASETLAARCRGVKALALLNDRQALEDDLRAAVVTNQSMLRKLGVLASSQEDRWSSEQADQITNSLYSGDPVLARAAFFALLGAMDRDSPGGQDRNTAFIRALGPNYTETPLSDFERMSGCAALGRCGSDWDTEYPGPAPDAAVMRLTEKYRAAVESRMDARSIMAIR